MKKKWSKEKIGPKKFQEKKLAKKMAEKNWPEKNVTEILAATLAAPHKSCFCQKIILKKKCRIIKPNLALPFIKASIAQLIEHAGLNLRTGVRFPSEEVFFN